MLEDILTRTFQKCSKEELIEIVIGFILNQHPQKKPQYSNYRLPYSLNKDLKLEFIFETRVGAEVVLDAISNVVTAGMAVTLSDVHVMCGYSPDEEYKKIGFTNMDGFYITHKRDGWALCLPTPTKIGGYPMAFDINESIKYQSWLNQLNPIGKCFVRVKYKPEYYNGASEILRWNTEAGVTAFWRDEKTPEGIVVTSIWWRWIEDFDILLYDPGVST